MLGHVLFTSEYEEDFTWMLDAFDKSVEGLDAVPIDLFVTDGDLQMERANSKGITASLSLCINSSPTIQ